MHAQVVDHEQFVDARTLLSTAALVYERSTDQTRLTKVARITSLVGLVEKAVATLNKGFYADAERIVDECLRERSALTVEQPLSLRPPDCILFQGGESGAKAAVLLRVRAAGESDRATALTLLEKGQFEAAEVAAASASARCGWWASHVDNRNRGATGAVEDRDDERHDVIRLAEELTTMVAAAAGKARAEGCTAEGRNLKATGDLAGAVRAMFAAAKLFHAAGLITAAAAARAEANQTQAESLLLISFNLHGEDKFEAIAEHLRSAEALLLEAIETRSATRMTRKPSVARSFNNAGNTVAGDGNSTINGKDNNNNVSADGGPQAHLDDLYNFQSRVSGDIVMRGVVPALEAREYDLALQLMLEADEHYAKIRTGRWKMSAVVATGKEKAGVGAGAGGATAAAMSPKDLVVKRAAQDGDRLRADAATAIQKGKNPVKAQELLSKAETCMAWAGIDPVVAGAAAVAKDIKVFESRAAGDEISGRVILLLQDRDLERAKDTLTAALGKYRQVQLYSIHCHWSAHGDNRELPGTNG